jgi:NAD(P)-dependent dehydrogenase (short-subunit alcohol dehydrogenase family)
MVDISMHSLPLQGVAMTQQAHNPSLAVVTGATGMLGSATVRTLASRGVRTILIVRDEAKGRALVDQLNVPRTDTHHLVVGDLSEPRSVREIAGRVRSETDDIALLIHAAAALFHQRRVNSAGHEAMFATNVLSRFLLTHELQPLLAKGTAGRVINVTGPSPDRLDFDDLMAETNFNAFKQFRATNAANLQLAFELAHRAQGTGVTSNAYTPGALQSDLMTEMPALVRLITIPFGRNADGAAAALADLAIGDRHASTNGEFYKRAKPARPPKASLDTESQRRLWSECSRHVGVTPTPSTGDAQR